MQFRISDTFTDSLSRLTADEQKAVKTTAFDLQVNPSHPGLSFHKLDKGKDKNFWSVRVGRDIRVIVHKTQDSILLCYVDHHDKAYDWAERRKLETHPKTGAAQLVEIRETVQQVFVPAFAAEPRAAYKPAALLDHVSDDDLLSYGVPPDWLADVRAADEDSILLLADHLPAEAAEALIELATGGKPKVPTPVAAETSPFEHPQALRRFRVMNNIEELERALEFPWDKWTIFLHPDQRQWVEREYSAPARVAGSAGTGKTIVALHRAVFLARKHPESRVLLTTFSDILSNALRIRLRRLVSNEPKLAERIDVHAMNAIGQRLYKAHIGELQLANSQDIAELLDAASAEAPPHKFSKHFLRTEWEQIVDAWQLASWEAYRDVARLGRKTRLPDQQRLLLWSIFEKVWAGLKAKGLVTHAGMFSQLAPVLAQTKSAPFAFVIVDEAQDVSVAQLRFLAALGPARADARPDALFFAGDLGQRIFQQPFSWKSLGVDVRGRSRTLKVNYRTSHQIRMQADRLLGAEVTDADGNTEERSATVSVFNGPAPEVKVVESIAAESELVSKWIAERIAAGTPLHEIGVFVRSAAELPRAQAALGSANIRNKVLDDSVDTTAGVVCVSTMHLAKGLEFRAVAVMACDDEVIPLQARIESVGDQADLNEVYETERHLLYVACTRARDHLLVTGVEPASEFLDDLGK